MTDLRNAERTSSKRGASADSVGGSRGFPQLNRQDLIAKFAPALVAIVVVMWILPQYVGTYWTFVLTTAIVSIPVMQSFGVITSRVGVISLCQLEFALFGAWTAGFCNEHHVPGGFYIWMLLAGVIAAPFGLFVGLTSLRLRGINLAIATFAFANAVDVIFGSYQFPGASSFEAVARPAGFASNGNFFRFAVIVVVILFVVLYLIDRTRLGSSWIELRYSERGAAAHGVNVGLSKLSAFIIAAFIAGVAGALTVGLEGSTTSSAFTAQGSLTYFAIVITLGVRQVSAAVLAGLAVTLTPVILNDVHVSANYSSVIFGVLAVFILAGGKGQLGASEIQKARKDAKVARRKLERGEPTVVRQRQSAPVLVGANPAPDDQSVPALEFKDVTVRFGAVTAVDGVSLSIPKGKVTALIGPNGAG
ncbi:MAG: ABC transporter permease subunit, partial [Acidimicrobiales bacterium]